MPVPNEMSLEAVAFAACTVMHCIHDLTEEPLQIIRKSSREGYARAVGKRIYCELLDGKSTEDAVANVCNFLCEITEGDEDAWEHFSKETRGQKKGPSFASPYTHRRVGKAPGSTTIENDLSKSKYKDDVLYLLKHAGYTGTNLCDPAVDEPANWAQIFQNELQSEYSRSVITQAALKLFNDIWKDIYKHPNGIDETEALLLLADATADPATHFAFMAPRRLAAIVGEQCTNKAAANKKIGYNNSHTQSRGSVTPSNGVLLAELLSFMERADLNALGVSGQKAGLTIVRGLSVDGDPSRPGMMPDRRYRPSSGSGLVQEVSDQKIDFQGWLNKHFTDAKPEENQLALWLYNQIYEGNFKPDPPEANASKSNNPRPLSDNDIIKITNMQKTDFPGSMNHPSDEQIRGAYGKIQQFAISLRSGRKEG